ncbi:MAG: outer membrane protein assembly factor BamD [Pseudomonadota bacterium]
MKRIFKNSLFLFIVLLAGCSSTADEKPQTPDEIYDQAQAAYEKGAYKDAAELFTTLEQEFPYSKHTKDGLLKTAYAQFETEDYEEAAMTAERYLELYPGAKNSDYALHLIAMSHYNRISDPRRDQSFAEQSRKYLRELIGRYPASEYAIDARIKLDFVNDQLAAKEMQVGRFYLSQDQVPAAINRFKVVVRKHQTTVHVQEALYRLVEGYLILGLDAPARKAAILLGHNYPDSQWYHDAYKIMSQVQPEFAPGEITEQEEKSLWDFFL